MSDTVKAFRPWVLFAGYILIVAVLYWAQAVLVPVAVALLLTFVLRPIVTGAERWMGRVAAVLAVVALVFTALGLAGWGFAREATRLAAELPTYRHNILQKAEDVRSLGKGGSVEQLQSTLEDIKEEIAKSEPPRGTPAQPVVVTSEQVATLWGFPTWVGSVLEPLATVGLVLVLVIFMLLERQELRNRLIGLIGHGHLATTTRAFDEAATRVSRYLLMQSLINVTYGIGVGVGLLWIGVPHPLLWAALAAVLRFIPYIGPWIGAAGPLFVSLAAFPGWVQTAWVAALFIGLELFTNLVLETFLYAGAAGVSQVALLVAVAFWTWLWGPLGLLMATPLTVCLAVLGKHMPGLEFVSTLMADSPALAPDVSFYQRLLARDQSEAADLIERYTKTHPPETVYDALLLPALNYAERDRLEERLSVDEEAAVIEATRELLAEAATATTATRTRTDEQPGVTQRIEMMCYPANSQADQVALEMLGDVLKGTPLDVTIVGPRTLLSEMVNAVQEQACRILCIADLPPSAPSKTRYLVKKLRAVAPDLKILVGRWAPPALADETVEPLIDAGANHVGTTLLETRDQLRQLVQHVALGLPKATIDAA